MNKNDDKLLLYFPDSKFLLDSFFGFWRADSFDLSHYEQMLECSFEGDNAMMRCCSVGTTLDHYLINHFASTYINRCVVWKGRGGLSDKLRQIEEYLLCALSYDICISSQKDRGSSIGHRINSKLHALSVHSLNSWVVWASRQQSIKLIGAKSEPHHQLNSILDTSSKKLLEPNINTACSHGVLKMRTPASIEPCSTSSLQRSSKDALINLS